MRNWCEFDVPCSVAEQSNTAPKRYHLAVERGVGGCDTDEMGDNLGDSLGSPKMPTSASRRGSALAA